LIDNAHADTTTINQKGMPVPSAMAPSISGFSNDMCRSGVSGGANTGVVSISGGMTIIDENCERIKIFNAFNTGGLKVTGVSVLCQDIRGWNAMEMSGSPCPYAGMMGHAARKAWFKSYPERFKALYGEDFNLPELPPVTDSK
jgi:hypothetical protein